MKNLYSILDYGAVSGKSEVQTEAIQKAIDDADINGGTVVVPKGVYKTGTLNLKGADLYLEKGAVLLASDNKDDYKEIGYIHCEFGETISLLYSLENKDICVYGSGTIDLNGTAFFDFSTYNLPENLKDKFSQEQKEESTAFYNWRPNQPIFFYKCTNVVFKDITILDAPCWTITFAECKKVRIDGITNIGHERIPNNDGIHISASENVIISNCNITSADDCIAISSITNWSVPCKNITITNCILKSFSKSIVVGHAHSIVKNVTVSNCQILESNRAFCIMTSTTGLIENVVVSNIYMDTRVRAGNWWGNGEPICVFAVPYTTMDHVDHTEELENRNYKINIKDVLFENIICDAENAIGVIGNNNIKNIHFNNILIKLKESDNLSIKGKVFDTSPADYTPIVESDDFDCIFMSKNSDVKLNQVSGCGINGKEGKVIVENN